mmetsp:Transcript_8678/g.18673  ORF Transcript_8678/g.18673 Transcript_8678/m.18673 type:complete len:125 (-) Transcript_8678:820-1194(-)
MLSRYSGFSSISWNSDDHVSSRPKGIIIRPLLGPSPEAKDRVNDEGDSRGKGHGDHGRVNLPQSPPRKDQSASVQTDYFRQYQTEVTGRPPRETLAQSRASGALLPVVDAVCARFLETICQNGP